MTSTKLGDRKRQDEITLDRNWCEVHHNWFPKHSDAKEAVRSFAKTKVFDNAFGEKPKMAK